MIESIEFTNFKALRKTKLPLAPFTLLLGPNGSGKTTVLQAIAGVAASTSGFMAEQIGLPLSGIRSVTEEQNDAPAGVTLQFDSRKRRIAAAFRWEPSGEISARYWNPAGTELTPGEKQNVREWLQRMRCFALDANVIAEPFKVSAAPLTPSGAGLASVLDDLRDHPERWNAFLDEMREWLPEYDQIQFDKPKDGMKSIALRTKAGAHRIPAAQLSQGTLVALALLTLAYLPDPPSLIGLEEIDRGLHPRLLRHLQDALYRLSYPENYGEERPPIQVIATTHSPYLLDLYREHPKEVVLAEKKGLEVEFKRLSDIDHFTDILGDSPLSEVWYSGVLGGVSVTP